MTAIANRRLPSVPLCRRLWRVGGLVVPVFLATLALAASSAALRAQAQAQTDTVWMRRLEDQIRVLTREIERLSLGREVALADTAVAGLGPAASKVYRVEQGVSVGGYGEVLYEDFAGRREDGTPSGKAAQLDALRAIMYVGYRFNDRLVFNSEIEFEHGATGLAGKVALEFAYLDFEVRDDLGLRAGLLLVPMGFINEFHEPPVFLGTERPLTESRIIPTTWRESGLGFFGTRGRLEYRAYVVNSFDGVGGGSSKASGFSATGLRGGRQSGSKALAEDMAFVGRLDFGAAPGVLLGGSLFFGEAGQNRVLDGQEVDASTTIWEAHVEVKRGGVDFRALVAGASLTDVRALNALKGLTGEASIGREMLGWYVQAGYDVLHGLATRQAFVPYVRYERVNTQRDVPDGFAASPANDLTVISLGAAWRPLPQVIVKADWQRHTNGADTGVNQFNISLGYLY